MEPNDEVRKATILLVDDDSLIREMVHSVLTAARYHVLSAEDGPQGLDVAKDFKGEIQVLISDFQMPGMSGIELASALTEVRPRLKVLLMSGFPGGMLVLNEGWHFLAKPFVASQLTALVETLANPDKKSRFAQVLKQAEIGDVKPPRLSSEVAAYQASLKTKP